MNKHVVMIKLVSQLTEWLYTQGEVNRQSKKVYQEDLLQYTTCCIHNIV